MIVVAIVGNAAEHWVAVYFALRDKIDLSISIRSACLDQAPSSTGEPSMELPASRGM